MQLPECASCGHPRPIATRGLCDCCRSRCRRDHTIGRWGEVKAARLEMYAALRAAGWSLEWSAWEVGVSVRTAWRYEAEARDARSSGWPARRAA
jgi:hypothetical protein